MTDRLEPGVFEAKTPERTALATENEAVSSDIVMLSIAISLKRIADAMEHQSKSDRIRWAK